GWRPWGRPPGWSRPRPRAGSRTRGAAPREVARDASCDQAHQPPGNDDVAAYGPAGEVRLDPHVRERRGEHLAFVRIGGHRDAGADLAVHLDWQLDRLAHECRRIDGGPGLDVERRRVPHELPQ